MRNYCDRHGVSVCGSQYSTKSEDYLWDQTNANLPLLSLDAAEHESAYRPLLLINRFSHLLKEFSPDVIFLPSYWNWSLHLHFQAKLHGIKTVMMNESHAGTESAKGLKRFVKSLIVRRFDAGLIGGIPHRRHFSQLGLNPKRLFVGYDAVDNEFFHEASFHFRKNRLSTKESFALPDCYILSLGRFVSKKNLSTLVRAFSVLSRSLESCPSLVFVGSGETETMLRNEACELGISYRDVGSKGDQAPEPGEIGFYGFRQIDENPAFYALAEFFVLPSLWEEWGLVVNEAMACGLPVLVSSAAGCAEDLVDYGGNGYTFDPKNPNELAERMMELSLNQEMRTRMGDRSREIIRHWGCDNFARQALKAAEAALQN